MKAKVMLLFESVHGKIECDYYARVMYGKQIIQRCPRRNRPPTAAQVKARQRFAEKYAGNKGKVQDGNGMVTEW